MKKRKNILIIIIILLLFLMLLFLGIKSINKTEDTIVNKHDNQLVTEEPKKVEAFDEVITEVNDEEIIDEIGDSDITNMYFFVITYDQFGNELSRTTAKYGTTVKDPDGNNVIVKGNLYFHKNVDYSSSKDNNKEEVFNPKERDHNPREEEEHKPKEVNYLYIKNIGTEEASFYIYDNEPGSNDDIKLEYSYDKLEWHDLICSNDFAINDITIPVNNTVYLKAKTFNSYFNITESCGLDIESNDEPNESKALEVGGSVMTLLDPTDTLRDISNSPYCFYYLFYEIANLSNANNLVFPATKLSSSCYFRAFYGCSSLKTVNKHLLPANDLTGAEECYRYMFDGCSSLTDVPNLPATKLSPYCYCQMFNGCTSLKSVSKYLLPAKDLTDADSCYCEMFSGCSSLTNVPNLPSLKLADNCYSMMFKNCVGLITVPTNLLPAKDLTGADYCYHAMFEFCTSLIKVPDLPATKLSPFCYNAMFYTCNGLETVPEDLLLAKDLTGAEGCYDVMFRHCSSLTNVPNLPATKLASRCYDSMFYECTSLTSLPNDLLQANDLTGADNCYKSMFGFCKSLTNVPDLHASTLSPSCYKKMFESCLILENIPYDLLPVTNLSDCSNCYEEMFAHCIKLKNAPKLPATILAPECYKSMFLECLLLNEIEVGFSSFDSLPENATNGWLSSVAEVGTFKWPGDSVFEMRSNSTVPENWSIEHLD